MSLNTHLGHIAILLFTLVFVLFIKPNWKPGPYFLGVQVLLYVVNIFVAYT